jgi:hypothetical protein
MDSPNPDDFGFGILEAGDWGVPQPQPPVKGTEPWLNQDAPNPDDFGLGFPQDQPVVKDQQPMDQPLLDQPLEDEIQ